MVQFYNLLIICFRVILLGDFAQILGHVFGSENLKEATVVDLKTLKNSSYEYFEFYF